MFGSPSYPTRDRALMAKAGLFPYVVVPLYDRPMTLPTAIPRRLFTAKEAKAIFEAGIPDEHGEVPELINFELIDGEFLDLIPPGSPDVPISCSARLYRAYPYENVRQCAPLDCGSKYTLPVPEYVILRTVSPEFAVRDPRGDETLLTVEPFREPVLVAKKLAAYAQGGVPECWFIAEEARMIHVHKGLRDGKYTVHFCATATDTLPLPGSESSLSCDFLIGLSNEAQEAMQRAIDSLLEDLKGYWKGVTIKTILKDVEKRTGEIAAHGLVGAKYRCLLGYGYFNGTPITEETFGPRVYWEE